MPTTFNCSQSRRRTRRLLALVAQDQSFVITNNEREVCRLIFSAAKENKHKRSHETAPPICRYATSRIIYTKAVLST
jgi:hypothetical protein